MLISYISRPRNSTKCAYILLVSVSSTNNVHIHFRVEGVEKGLGRRYLAVDAALEQQ